MARARLASIDTRTGETLLVGVPRNRFGTRDVAGRWRIAYDAATVPVLAQVEELTGQQVDATVTLDMAGFEQLVDAIGGVEVTVPRQLPVGGARRSGGGVLAKPTEYLPAGTQRLDGRDDEDQDADEQLVAARSIVAAFGGRER